MYFIITLALLVAAYAVCMKGRDSKVLTDKVRLYGTASLLFIFTPVFLVFGVVSQAGPKGVGEAAVELWIFVAIPAFVFGILRMQIRKIRRCMNSRQNLSAELLETL